MHQQAGFILNPIINKVLNTDCFKYAFKKTYPTFTPSVTSTYLTHLKPTVFGDPVRHFCDHLPLESWLVQHYF